VGLYEDIYTARWVIYETQGASSGQDLQTMITRVGCKLDLEEQGTGGIMKLPYLRTGHNLAIQLVAVSSQQAFDKRGQIAVFFDMLEQNSFGSSLID
jgi:hypothetical protein